MQVKIVTMGDKVSWYPARIENGKETSLSCPFRQDQQCSSLCPLLDIIQHPNYIEEVCVWRCGSGQQEAKIIGYKKNS